MKLKNGQTVLFTGDSITDCGRGRPVGAKAELGEGYVAMVNSMLYAAYPERNIRVLNTGISGNRVTNLEERWQSDVLDLAPDWLSVMIGINDVWRQFDSKIYMEQVDLKKYEESYRKILADVRPSLKGLVLMTPYYLEASKQDPMRKMMDDYSAVVAKLAEEFDAVFVDVQAAFDAFMEHQPTQSLCWDRVHPNKTGHMIIARSFLKGIGFDR